MDNKNGQNIKILLRRVVTLCLFSQLSRVTKYMDITMKKTTSLLRVYALCLCIQFSVSILCTEPCYCYNYTMFCNNGAIPVHFPYEIRELFIEQFDFRDFNGSKFKNVSNILKLDIQSEHGDYIPSKSFAQFKKLTYLGLHGKEIKYISQDAFFELNKLLTLNLSYNPRLGASNISKALNSENRENKVMPNLKSLSIARIKTSLLIPVNLDSYFFKSVASGRKLKYLDLSQLSISQLNFRDLMILCESVEHVLARNSVIGSAIKYWNISGCNSIRTIDVSGSVIPAFRIKFSFQTLNFSCESLKFYTYLETLLANKVNTEYDIEIDDYVLDMSKCPLRFRKLSIAENKIKWGNATVYLHEITKRSLSEINISYNYIEYLSPLVLKPSENIRILDLSNNRLNIMQEKYTQKFERLFWAQKKLLHLNLSHNSLSKIPLQTFTANRLLETLDISYNKIVTLDFSVKQLVNIEKLIVTHNKLYTIEQSTRIDLQMLLPRVSHKFPGNDSRKFFHVYLSNNKFQCTCDRENVELIQWLHYSKTVYDGETVSCKLGENIVDIRTKGLQETNKFCRIKTIKKIAMISTPIVSIAVIFIIISVLLIRKRRKIKSTIREVIARIKTGKFPLKYLVFLSYCSEDTDLALKKIYPQLCKTLSEMTSSSETLVCIGDKHFRPGFSLIGEVMRCVEESSVFVAIISRNFCRKMYCNLEIKEAYELNRPIVLLMVEHVEKELMEDFLRKIFDRYTHATWKTDQSGGHLEPEWTIFCKSIIQLSWKEATKNIEHFV